MKPLLLSTSDIEGGAARSAYRLNQGFQKVGIDSQMLVRLKLSRDRTVMAQKDIVTKLGPTMDSWLLRKYPNRDRNGTRFWSQWFPDSIAPTVSQLNPDIVNMHWVCNGYLQIETLKKLKRPLVWTLQDMWPFTGGCCYSFDCDSYKASCGNCPRLHSRQEKDLSRQIWQRKAKSWKNINLTIVAPSTWMAECARASSLFQDLRVEVIPFGLDTKVYRPLNKGFSRSVLDLPQDKQLILFGALDATSDRRKGFDLLKQALFKLSKAKLSIKNTEVVIFGSNKPKKPIDTGFKSHYMGHLNDDISLSLVYSAADIMVVPSLYESFGQTASEALACGTPVVAFNATGLKDIVEHQQNGYLANPYHADDLAEGIFWVLEDCERHGRLCEQAHIKAELKFTLERQAYQYLSLYNDILTRNNSGNTENSLQPQLSRQIIESIL